MGANSTDTEWGELGPTQAWKAARRYAALGDRSGVQRASTVVSATVSLTLASLAGMVVGRGPVAAKAGTEREYRGLAVFRALLAAAIGIALGTLVTTTVPASYSFGVMVAFELIIIGWMASILPSLRFHRSRGLRLNARRWKRSHRVRQLWIVSALVHDPEATADELEAALRTLVPDLSPGWASIVFTTTDVQVQALQCLGFSRASENSGLMYRTVTAALQPSR
ncbi:hypothetical protein [Arthrobacter ramosus]|uniref:Uncharacterized protein n=1 Tax=Arthrobacter ramosus TaxID=1672 RepID=A0ABV5Y0S7_ARTRM|nr:hypothetical protein [Arthrobacter ramosus]